MIVRMPIKLTLKLPVGINHLYKSGKNGWYKDKKAVDWQEEALWKIKQQMGTQKPLEDASFVSIKWFRKDDRRYDVDGGIKLLLDTLVKAEVLEDDSQIITLWAEKHKTDKEHYCEVLIL